MSFVTFNYCKVAISRPVYYSILNSFGQRSQYISIKFPLHKPSENLKMCWQATARDFTVAYFNKVDLFGLFMKINRIFYLSIDERTVSNSQNHSSMHNSKEILVMSECIKSRHQNHSCSICANFPITNSSMIFWTKVSNEPTHKQGLKNPQQNFFIKYIYTPK